MKKYYGIIDNKTTMNDVIDIIYKKIDNSLTVDDYSTCNVQKYNWDIDKNNVGVITGGILWFNLDKEEIRLTFHSLDEINLLYTENKEDIIGITEILKYASGFYAEQDEKEMTLIYIKQQEDFISKQNEIKKEKIKTILNGEKMSFDINEVTNLLLKYKNELKNEL